jgi:CopG family nickel-responsive transcriptional regulator
MDARVRQHVSRISISLQEKVLHELDQMVADCGFDSRSQAISEMINRQVAEHKTRFDDAVMVGTINLVFDHSVHGLRKRLTDLQHAYIDEVISSLNVNLVDAQTLEVILVQGPAKKLKMIADQMSSCKGVHTGQLLMSTAIMPPLHPLPEKSYANES